jgi:hypothetical protein
LLVVLTLTVTMSLYNGVLYPADPPEGVERDPNQSPDANVLIVVTGITFAISTISMAIRMYARVILIKKFAFDDCELTRSND